MPLRIFKSCYSFNWMRLSGKLCPRSVCDIKDNHETTQVLFSQYLGMGCLTTSHQIFKVIFLQFFKLLLVHKEPLLQEWWEDYRKKRLLI